MLQNVTKYILLVLFPDWKIMRQTYDFTLLLHNIVALTDVYPPSLICAAASLDHHRIVGHEVIANAEFVYHPPKLAPERASAEGRK